MGAQENRNKSQKMAADMIARGIWHGKRTTTTHAPPTPVDQAGSAAYRRMMNKRKG